MTNAHETISAALISDLHDIWNKGDLGRIPQVYAKDFVAHMPKGWEQSEFRGHAGVEKAICRVRNAFSDWRETVQDMIIAPSKVVTRYVSTGKHTGPFLGFEPTNRSVEIAEISIYHLRDGPVAEQ